jgi:CubicO group peptidase (beta-lactamase class C family)
MQRDFLQKSLILILWVLLFHSCLPEGEYKISINFEPRMINDGWEISTASAQGFSPERLHDIYEMMFAEDRFLTSRSLLIARNGKLISESYFRSMDDINRKNSIQCITKGITSLLAGFAWDSGLIQLDDKLYGYIPGYFDANRDKRDITIDHVLTMRTGLDWDNDRYTRDLFNSSRFPSSVRIVLTKPFLAGGGTLFHDNHGAPQLLMGVLRKVFETGETVPVIQKLFDPLGIDDFVWEGHDDGLNIGGVGLHLKPRDLALIGQFCLQNGRWKGEQIVSGEWLDAATGSQLGPDMTGSFLHFGYYWWIHTENNAFFGMGKGGQYLYIMPGKELVIVHTACPHVGSGYEGVDLRDFLDLVDRILAAADVE